MAISKITLNGVTQMDVTGKTVTPETMLDGVTALKNDGTDITGNVTFGPISTAWEIGSIRADDGTDTASNYRARTTNYIKIDPSIYVVFKNQSVSEITIRLYSSTYSGIQITAVWYTSDFNLSEIIASASPPSTPSYVRFMARYNDDRRVTDADELASDFAILGIV